MKSKVYEIFATGEPLTVEAMNSENLTITINYNLFDSEKTVKKINQLREEIQELKTIISKSE